MTIQTHPNLLAKHRLWYWKCIINSLGWAHNVRSYILQRFPRPYRQTALLLIGVILSAAAGYISFILWP